MNKRLAASSLAALSLLLGGVAVSCNSDDDSDYDIDTGYTTETLYSSTAITAFNLKADADVLANLDSVFFTIDLEGQRIFNADSMPLGTSVKKLVPVIGTGGSATIVVNYTDTLGVDQEVEYNSSSPDTICFATPVRVTVTSLNESYSRTYTITVNVHQQQPDTLCWGDMAYSRLPALANPVDAVTVEHGGALYCYSTDGSAYQRATAADPSATAEAWAAESVGFGFTPRLATMTATDGLFYVLADDGALWESADGLAWTATGQTWLWIYGAYQEQALGVASDGAGGHLHVAWPAPSGYAPAPVDSDFPIGGTSPMLTFSSQWAAAPQGIIVGGHRADGTLSDATWGFDGNQWRRFSTLPDGAALDGMVLFPYYTFKTSTVNWTVTQQSAIFAMGGRDADGNLSRTTYITRDLGLNWQEADSLLQIPEEMESWAGARAVVATTTMQARAAADADGWQSVGLRRLPAWCTLVDVSAASRATAPVDEWECPYIYIYGGEQSDRQLRDIVLRGVINRFTYKPLQ